MDRTRKIQIGRIGADTAIRYPTTYLRGYFGNWDKMKDYTCKFNEPIIYFLEHGRPIFDYRARTRTTTQQYFFLPLFPYIQELIPKNALFYDETIVRYNYPVITKDLIKDI